MRGSKAIITYLVLLSREKERYTMCTGLRTVLTFELLNELELSRAAEKTRAGVAKDVGDMVGV